MRRNIKLDGYPPNLLPPEERARIQQLAAHAGARAESPDALKKAHELSADESPDALKKVPELSISPVVALTLSLDEVAQILGLDARQLKRKARELRARHAFPPPLPGSDWRFSRAAVEAWIAASGQGGGPKGEDDGSPVDVPTLVGLQNAHLRGRYGGGR